jgi:hypothetical protein
LDSIQNKLYSLQLISVNIYFNLSAAEDSLELNQAFTLFYKLGLGTVVLHVVVWRAYAFPLLFKIGNFN